MSKMYIRLLLAVSIGINLGVVGMTLMRNTSPNFQGPPPGPPKGENHAPGKHPAPGLLVDDHIQRMTHHLDLNLEQQEAIRTIMETYSPQLTELRRNVEQNSLSLTREFLAHSFDPESFRRQASELSAARARIDSLSALMLASEAAVLDTRQRREFAKIAPLFNAPRQTPPRHGGPPRR